MDTCELNNLLKDVLYKSASTIDSSIPGEHKKLKKRIAPTKLTDPPRKYIKKETFEVKLNDYKYLKDLKMFEFKGKEENLTKEQDELKKIGRSMITTVDILEGQKIFPAVKWEIFSNVEMNDVIEREKETYVDKVWRETGVHDAMVLVRPYLFIPIDFDSKTLDGHAWYLMNHSKQGNARFKLIRDDNIVKGFEMIATRDIKKGEHICFSYTALVPDTFKYYIDLHMIDIEKYKKYLSDINFESSVE